MGRPKRIQFPGACYYVTLVGNNRQDLFLSNQDRRYFLSLLRRCKEHYDLKVYAYCLLANEVHLLVETAQPNLSLAMQGFNTQYTKYFNAAHDTVGHLFQGRYKALIVDKEHFLPRMTAFIHLKPGPERPWRYQWSSGPAYLESDARDPLVDSREVLRRLGHSRLVQSVRYLRFLKERMQGASSEVLPVLRGLFVGGEPFAEKIGSMPENPGDLDGSAQLVSRIVAEVTAKHGVEEERLTGRGQWRELSAVRREAIRRIWREARWGVTRIGQMFHRTPSAISQLIRSMEAADQRRGRR